MEQEMILQSLLVENIQKKNVYGLRDLFENYHEADIAEAIEKLTPEDILFVFKTVSQNYTGQLLPYLENDTIETLIQLLSSRDLKSILDNIYSDDIVDFLQELPASLTKKVLGSASADQKADINRLLSYEEDSAGSMMSTSYLELSETDTIETAMNKIKKYRKETETIGRCFVVNQKDQLVGTLRLKDILFAPNTEIVSEIMDTDYVSVLTTDDSETAAKTLQKYDISVIPVVDEFEHMVGIITADDVIDILQDEATEDIQKMAAITPLDDEYLEAKPFKIATSRLVWLLVLMVSYAFSSLIISNNNDLLLSIPSLITFVPMLMGTAGNAGSQASAMVIRGITVDDLTIKDFFRVLRKELGVAVLCGLVLATVNILRIILFVPNVQTEMAFVVSITIFLVVIFAKLVGGLLPLMALVLKLDPAAMASPMITTACDSLSLIIYFALASMWVLR